MSNNWNQLGSDIDGEAADDYSGYSVSLSSEMDNNDGWFKLRCTCLSI